MNGKVFTQRFNRELAALDFPTDIKEKVIAVNKVFGLKKQIANDMIFGYIFPTSNQLLHIARILDVCPAWLCGDTERKRTFPEKELISEE